MSKIQITSTTPFIDEIPVEFNPEFADLGNPDGAIYERFHFIAAVTKDGRRFISSEAKFDLDEEVKAIRFAERVLAAGEINLEYWNETYEVYGSSAWEAADAEREAIHQANPNTQGTIRDF